MGIHKEMTNADRAYRGWRAIARFKSHEPPAETDLRDLLADLMHYADEQGIDFKYELEMATTHYDAEMQEQDK